MSEQVPNLRAMCARPLLSIAHLLLAIGFLELGSGLQAVLIPVRAQAEGFSTQVIGLLGTAYYLGFVCGCVAVPAVMQRIGHIRAFSGFASAAAAAFLLHEALAWEPTWLALRVIIGFCFAGLYMAVESWLNERATTETRGRILGVYMVVSWIAALGGKLVFAWTDPGSFLPFALVTVGICLAGVPVAFTTESVPQPAPRGGLRLRELYRISPVGLTGCLCVGAANGAFWSLAPIYAESRGLSTVQIGLFMAVAVLGGAISQWPLGRWSDATDRRRVIASLCLAAAAAAGALVLRDGSRESLMLILAFLFGTAALPLYALCVAHANDHAPPGSFVEVSSDLLMMFGVGAIFGPYAAALLMSFVGQAGLFMFCGAVHLMLAGFTIFRIVQQRPVPAAVKEVFVVVPGSTPAVLSLDPRSDGEAGRESGGEAREAG